MSFVADPRLSPLSSQQLARWIDRPVRRTFPRLERTLLALARISGAGRPLAALESDLLTSIFGDSLDYGPIRVVETSWLNAPTVLGNTIRVRPGYQFSGRNAAVLVHEAMHVWQFQHFGTGYISDSIYHNVRSLVRTGRRGVAYLNYQLTDESRLADFTSEQQATIIADYFDLTRTYPADASEPVWVIARRPFLPIYQRIVAEVTRAPAA